MDISSALFNSLMLKYESEIQINKTNLLIYFEKSVGIADHPDQLKDMDDLISKISEANDKLKILKSMFQRYSKL